MLSSGWRLKRSSLSRNNNWGQDRMWICSTPGVVLREPIANWRWFCISHYLWRRIRESRPWSPTSRSDIENRWAKDKYERWTTWLRLNGNSRFGIDRKHAGLRTDSEFATQPRLAADRDQARNSSRARFA